MPNEKKWYTVPASCQWLICPYAMCFHGQLRPACIFSIAYCRVPRFCSFIIIEHNTEYLLSISLKAIDISTCVFLISYPLVYIKSKKSIGLNMKEGRI